jgi:ubiquinone/menaquinone biosynthesis C-methylase UbiE
MMKTNYYVCPRTGGDLELIVDEEHNGVIINGRFRGKNGDTYPIKDSVPNFTYPPTLTAAQRAQYEYYESNAEGYDDLQGLTFAIQNEDEIAVRKGMVSELRIHGAAKVLEVSCGTGRDSENIAALLDKDGELSVQDISGAMLKQCKKRLQRFSVPINYSVGNASYLAFPDKYFDAVFSFGGLNVFEDRKRSLKEMVRVTKSNGRIVVGDESLPPWLYDTEFGKILLIGNPLFRFKLPLDDLPVEAREVAIRWIIGGVYYLIAFTVGQGEPVGNFDVEIPGKRGGTLKTRYHGQLEGVTEETKRLVLIAAKNADTSIHRWLDRVLRQAAKEEIRA